MYIIIGCALIVFMIFFVEIFKEEEPFGDRLDFSILGGIIGGVTGLLVSFVVGISIPASIQPDFTLELAALKTKSTISGQFFLGSGTIDGKAKYYFYYKKEDGGFVPKSIDINGVTIYEDEEEEPYLLVYKHTFNNEKLKKWFIDLHYTNKVDFHIPKGSITEIYNADL